MELSARRGARRTCNINQDEMSAGRTRGACRKKILRMKIYPDKALKNKVLKTNDKKSHRCKLLVLKGLLAFRMTS